MSGKDTELEVKFYLSRRRELEAKLASLGARLSEPRVLEVNLRFDTPDLDLLYSGRLLRLRSDTKAIVTYIGAGSVDGGARLRQELEFVVSDFATAQSVFEALGYTVFMMYEKYRTTFRLGDLVVAVDEMPYGDFVEIEGPDGASIQQAAIKMGLDWETRILESYTVLFERARVHLGFDSRDLSFENFSGFTVKPEDLEVSTADQST
jgi:adenylate cyclase class 2